MNNMETSNVIVEKTEAFAIRIVNLYKFLRFNDNETKRETVLSKQVLRSGTSIGANVAEAQYGCTKKEFRAKMQIAIKEANETCYWLKLLKATDYLDKNQFESIINDCSEIIKILTAIINSSNANDQ